jgi:hypothetical protein
VESVENAPEREFFGKYGERLPGDRHIWGMFFHNPGVEKKGNFLLCFPLLP